MIYIMPESTTESGCITAVEPIQGNAIQESGIIWHITHYIFLVFYFNNKSESK